MCIIGGFGGCDNSNNNDDDDDNIIIEMKNNDANDDGGDDETRVCAECSHRYPIELFIVKSSGNLRRDGTRGAQRISKRKICKPCCNKKYRKKS